MLNHVIIAGRMARDPELRHTNTGTAVTSFTLAVDRDFKDQSGERLTDWIDCVAWKSAAEFLCRYTQKGSIVMVDGRLQVRDWTDNNGNKRRSVEVIADNVYFGERKREEQNDYTRQVWPEPKAENTLQESEQFTEIDSDGPIPF